MSDHGAAIRSPIQEAKPSAGGHVAHEPRRALILPEPEAEGAGTESGPSLPGRISAGAEQQRVKMRQRIARFGSSRPQTPALDPLFQVIRANHPKADLALVERAYRKAERLHSGQTRKSGDAFITHPLAVTTILAELGMTEATLCAALLHDTVEDTDYTLGVTTLIGERFVGIDNCIPTGQSSDGWQLCLPRTSAPAPRIPNSPRSRDECSA